MEEIKELEAKNKHLEDLLNNSLEELEKIQNEKTKEKSIGLASYDELRKVDVTPWVDKRDNADYLNWAKVVDLLHEYGAKEVYFQPIVNEVTGSSLFMTDQVFTDSKGNTNRVYETAVKIVIDDLKFVQRGPVTNGANPVKDNSMSQQRLWNCQTRLFVKGVAIRTGLGFDLWLKEEDRNEKENFEDDLSKHNIIKVAERMKEKLTSKMQLGLTFEEIAEQLNVTSDTLKSYLCYYDILNRLEKALDKVDKKQG